MRKLLFSFVLSCVFFSLNALNVSYSPATLSCGTTVVTATFDCAFNGAIFMTATGGADFDTDPPIFTAVNGSFTFNVIIEPGDATTITLSANILSSDLPCATGANSQASSTISHDCIPPPNDNCANATFIPLTQSSCNLTSNPTNNQSVSGTVPSCSIAGYVDLWYTFTANNSTVSIFLGNLPGTFARYGVYESCGGAEVGCGFYLQNGAAQMITNLTLNQDYIVQIQTISSQSGSGINQEVCFFSETAQSNTVPVIIEKFDVTKINDSQINCNFTLSRSYDLEHLELQKRSDNNTFYSTIYTDVSQGDDVEQFQFIDRDIDGDNRYYYRLKTVDLDGKILFSDVKSVDTYITENESVIRVFPNPTSSGAVISLPVTGDAEVNIWIQTLEQKKSTHFIVNAILGVADQRINVPRDFLSTGLNILVIQIGDKVYREKLIHI